jgi:hypothetical protein
MASINIPKLSFILKNKKVTLDKSKNDDNKSTIPIKDNV